MDIANNPSFEWLRQECATIKSQQFHVFHKFNEPSGGGVYEVDGKCVPVGGDYGDFMKEFGWTDLFNGWGNLPEVVLTIYPLKSYRREVLKNGKAYIGFGDKGNQHVCFDEEMILAGEPSKVYAVSKKQATEIYPGFSEWLFVAYEWAKSKYSPKQWKIVIDGAKPFSDAEVEIVEARRKYTFNLVGFADDGDALLEVANNSKMVLPFLTVGIKDSEDRILIGGTWLNVAAIRPSERAIIKADCYKDQIPPDKLVVFHKPDPIPENRDRYREFEIA